MVQNSRFSAILAICSCFLDHSCTRKWWKSYFLKHQKVRFSVRKPVYFSYWKGPKYGLRYGKYVILEQNDRKSVIFGHFAQSRPVLAGFSTVLLKLSFLPGWCPKCHFLVLIWGTSLTEMSRGRTSKIGLSEGHLGPEKCLFRVQNTVIFQQNWSKTPLFSGGIWSRNPRNDQKMIILDTFGTPLNMVVQTEIQRIPSCIWSQKGHFWVQKVSFWSKTIISGQKRARRALVFRGFEQNQLILVQNQLFFGPKSMILVQNLWNTVYIGVYVYAIWCIVYGACLWWAPCMYVPVYHPVYTCTTSLPRHAHWRPVFSAVLDLILAFGPGSHLARLAVARASQKAQKGHLEPFLALYGPLLRAEKPSFGGPKGPLRQPF